MRQKSLRRRFVILPTPFMHKTFRYPRFFETPKSSPRSFSVQWDKKIDRIVIPYYPKTIRYQNISERQASFYEYFRYCGTNRIDKVVIPLLSKKKLLYDAFWWCETNKFDKIVIPLLPRNFFLPEQFWNTERFAHDVFWRCEAKVFRRKKVTPHFLSIFFFHTRTFLKHKRVPPRSFSVLLDWKFSPENRQTPPFCIKILDAAN